ncbi:MAG: hypothetical protein JMDDDDMK_03504 [Acidobacteria bacterium]|nr:hypothetical protein [Acidobacteriota bacterium]
MRTSRRFSSLPVLAALFLMSVTALAADPGLPFSDDSPVSDQKAGSVLFYNIYTSSATTPASENTRINITNTSSSRAVSVHLFFIDGSSCSPADSVLCLTPNQTASFNAADFDPGTMGYIVAIAMDGNGCPIKHNFLIGDEYVKFATGHEANLGAEAVGGVNVLPCDDTAPVHTLNFNGNEYGRLPATVAVDNIPSRVDGNDTLLILNRPSGNLSVGADPIGAVAGLLYNDSENAYSFSFTTNQCQIKFSVNNTIPRTAPRFTTVVPTGRTGWMKLYTYRDIPLLGAVINRSEAANASPGAFNQGHNLHKLRLTNSSVTIPIFPPNCG